jgi:rod shape determining protein RodA
MAFDLRDRVELSTLAAAILLVGIGLLSIYSATLDARMGDLFSKQLIAAAVGLIALVGAAFLPTRALQRIAYPIYFLSMLSLVTVFLIGKQVSGSTSWFAVGHFSIQPSEFAKVATVLALAAYLQRNDVHLSKLRDLIVVGAIIALPAGLILAQPDMGTAMIFFGMMIPVLFWGGAPTFALLALLSPGVVAIAALFGTTAFFVTLIALAVLIFLTRTNWISAAMVFSLLVFVGVSVQSFHDRLKPYQQKRIATFLDPSADPLGAGYNVAQAKVAIGSGGLFGKGFLKGTQTRLNFIPAQWTDFIYTVPGEEFGLLGASLVLLLLMVVLFRGVHIASVVKNPFGSFAAIGIVGVFATHIVINIGMALGLTPVVGVPLPFLSYGGSALVANMLMVGILLNLFAHRKEY